MKSLMLVTAIIILAISSIYGATYNFKLGYIIAEGTPIDIAAKKLAELVKQRTNGEVEITVYPASQLGGEMDIIEKVQLGTVEMSLTSTCAIALYAPELMVLDLPYLFPTYEAAYVYLDGENGQRLLKTLDSKGITGICYFENGWRNFTSSKNELKKPDDLKGQNIRVTQSPIYTEIIKAVGANPIPISYPELAKALREKVVDGEENPPVNVYSEKMYETQKWMVKDQHTYSAFIFKVNKKVWEALPETTQKIITNTAFEMRDFERKLNRECDPIYTTQLQTKGMTVYEPTKEELLLYKTLTEPVYEKAKLVCGEEWVNNVMQFKNDWDNGKYQKDADKYIMNYKKISVPTNEVMKSLTN
jgi:tripartite ATP-independent transporter DctP family solute receptor